MVDRTCPICPAATIREIAGVETVATDTPKSPMGRYISRNA